MVCIIYEYSFCFHLSFLVSFRLGSIVMLILIVFTLHTSHALHLFCYYSVNASQESYLGTVVNMSTL